MQTLVGSHFANTGPTHRWRLIAETPIAVAVPRPFHHSGERGPERLQPRDGDEQFRFLQVPKWLTPFTGDPQRDIAPVARGSCRGTCNGNPGHPQSTLVRKGKSPKPGDVLEEGEKLELAHPRTTVALAKGGHSSSPIVTANNAGHGEDVVSEFEALLFELDPSRSCGGAQHCADGSHAS